MDFVWGHGPWAAVRKILRRLEAKGYLQHEVNLRTFLYRPSKAPQTVAALWKLCWWVWLTIRFSTANNSNISPRELHRRRDLPRSILLALAFGSILYAGRVRDAGIRLAAWTVVLWSGSTDEPP